MERAALASDTIGRDQLLQAAGEGKGKSSGEQQHEQCCGGRDDPDPTRQIGQPPFDIDPADDAIVARNRDRHRDGSPTPLFDGRRRTFDEAGCR